MQSDFALPSSDQLDKAALPSQLLLLINKW